MLTKNIVVGLLGLSTVAQAAALHRPFDHIMERRAAKALNVRQNGGGRFGGGFGGGNFGRQGNGGNGGNQGNQGQGNQGQGNQGQGNQDNADDAAADDAAADDAAADDAAADDAAADDAAADDAAADDNNGNGGNGGDAGTTTLDPDVIATGSQDDGLANADEGEAASLTDDANFINFCAGKTITNGLQDRDGSCNPIPMGDMPSANTMISAIMVNPAHNDDLTENETFDVQVQIDNLQAGTFTNPDVTYYAAPQQLNGQGQVIGHTHVVIQDLGNSLTPGQPPDAATFAFFKGINDAGDGNGLLAATVEGGLPAGNYRVCSMTGASNHQPVLMPVAQRGPQDDCNKFTVGAGNAGNQGNADDQGNAGNQGQGNQGQGNQGQGNQGQGNQGQGNQGQGNQGRGGRNNGNSNTQPGFSNSTNAGTNQATEGLGDLPAVTDSGDSDRPFEVNGNTFTDEATANTRACDIQNNSCSDLANGGAGFTLEDCQQQFTDCLAAV